MESAVIPVAGVVVGAPSSLAVSASICCVASVAITSTYRTSASFSWLVIDAPTVAIVAGNITLALSAPSSVAGRVLLGAPGPLVVVPARAVLGSLLFVVPTVTASAAAAVVVHSVLATLVVAPWLLSRTKTLVVFLVCRPLIPVSTNVGACAPVVSVVLILLQARVPRAGTTILSVLTGALMAASAVRAPAPSVLECTCTLATILNLIINVPSWTTGKRPSVKACVAAAFKTA